MAKQITCLQCQNIVTFEERPPRGWTKGPYCGKCNGYDTAKRVIYSLREVATINGKLTAEQRDKLKNAESFVKNIEKAAGDPKPRMVPIAAPQSKLEKMKKGKK